MTKKILSAEDRALFRETVGSVRAVKNDKAPDLGQGRPKPPPKPKTIHSQWVMDSTSDIPPVGIEDPLEFISEAAPKSSLAKLRQGHFTPEAEIDLHGLNSNEAKRELQAFLGYCVKSGCRCVHIVHGKGYRSTEHYPTLKNHVNVWLRQHPHVLAFCSAAPKDGGTGALYLLLSKPCPPPTFKP